MMALFLLAATAAKKTSPEGEFPFSLLNHPSAYFRRITQNVPSVEDLREEDS
jgi:hypothetical protein